MKLMLAFQLYAGSQSHSFSKQHAQEKSTTLRGRARVGEKYSRATSPGTRGNANAERTPAKLPCHGDKRRRRSAMTAVTAPVTCDVR
jgi:hypothetical protein